MKPNLWRDEIDVTKPGDTVQNFELGPLKASIFGIRIPACLVVWYYKRKQMMSGSAS